MDLLKEPLGEKQHLCDVGKQFAEPSGFRSWECTVARYCSLLEDTHKEVAQTVCLTKPQSGMRKHPDPGLGCPAGFSSHEGAWRRRLRRSLGNPKRHLEERGGSQTADANAGGA